MGNRLGINCWTSFTEYAIKITNTGRLFKKRDANLGNFEEVPQLRRGTGDNKLLNIQRSTNTTCGKKFRNQ